MKYARIAAILVWYFAVRAGQWGNASVFTMMGPFPDLAMCERMRAWTQFTPEGADGVSVCWEVK